MTAAQWIRLGVEIASEVWHEVRRERSARRAAEAWATTPAPTRACVRCREVAYTPGQTVCAKCGAGLRG